ncbi:MAG: hypothetical protein M1837_001843 [Sclerophora amabilis]|nr:MAG: hypothetical protein M1837_001843 [Sclerophora amabilis]
MSTKSPASSITTPPIPITIITGFLGSGKTTLILNLIPQLPASYRLALLKNEFGDVAIDSRLAASQSISGVQELLNGCICCNLVGQLGDALQTLRQDVRPSPDRIVIETSGSAFPATLAMEVNRLAAETGGAYVLDGVVAVIDVENWKGYEDTSYTARLQARYTDLVVFNKWEQAGERRFDECLDRLGDMETDVAWVKSDKGWVGKELVLGVDGGLARELGWEQGAAAAAAHDHADSHDHKNGHQTEVQVLSVTLRRPEDGSLDECVDVERLQSFLQSAPKEEIYRIKAILSAKTPPPSSSSSPSSPVPLAKPQADGVGTHQYILNWAFGRWTFTLLTPSSPPTNTSKLKVASSESPDASSSPSIEGAVLRMTIILARDEANKWKKRLEDGRQIALDNDPSPSIGSTLQVDRVL